MAIVITGATGFVGGYLAEALWAQGERDVVGLSRGTDWPAEWADLRGRVPLLCCDLTEPQGLRRALATLTPRVVYHLAGLTNVAQSLADPRAAWQVNLLGTLNLYDALAELPVKPTVLHVGTGMIYGSTGSGVQAFDELAELRPNSPYAASKAAADLAAYSYLSRGLPIVRARPFNHIGPRQSTQFAIAHFSHQIARIRLGLQEPTIKTGDLRPMRDLLDVRDVVAAYLVLVRHGTPGEVYNVGSGQAHSMQAVLERLQQLAGVQVNVLQEQARLRPADVTVSVANATKLRQSTGWAPRYSLDQTLQDMLTYFTQREQGQAQEERL
jgi:GDP-4-dehydro-6-deoxy-D-mannose reductase